MSGTQAISTYFLIVIAIIILNSHDIQSSMHHREFSDHGVDVESWDIEAPFNLIVSDLEFSWDYDDVARSAFIIGSLERC